MEPTAVPNPVPLNIDVRPLRKVRAVGSWPAAAPRLFVIVAGLLIGLQLGLTVHGLLTGQPESSWQFAVGNHLYAIAVAASGVAAFARAWMFAEERTAWLLIGAALISWAVGEALADPADAAAAGVAIADAFHLLFYVGAVAGLVVLGRREGASGSSQLDAAIILLGLSTIWSWLFLEHVVENIDGLTPGAALTLAYPIFDLALCLVLALVFIRSGWPRSGTWLMIGGAFVLAALADAFDTMPTFDAVGNTPLTDLAWAAAAMLLGLAALTAPGAGTAPDDRLGREFSFGLSIVFMAMATLVLTGDHVGPLAAPTVALAAGTLIAGTVRAVTVYRQRMQAEERLKGAALRAVQGLATVTDARDPATHSRSERVAFYCAALGARLGLDVNRIERLVIAGKLHDVGMTIVPDDILHKEGPLTSSEMDLVRRHPAEGARIVAAVGLEDVAEWILHHHERWDGHGYPDHLEGEAIPFESRVLAAADSLEAMITRRSYRSAMSIEMAILEITANMGTQFDPTVAAVLAEMLRTGDLEPEYGEETPEEIYTLTPPSDAPIGVAEYMRVQAALTET